MEINYNGYEFGPNDLPTPPSISISTTPYKTDGGAYLGAETTITLEGSYVGNGTLGNAFNLGNVGTLKFRCSLGASDYDGPGGSTYQPISKIDDKDFWVFHSAEVIGYKLTNTTDEYWMHHSDYVIELRCPATGFNRFIGLTDNNIKNVTTSSDISTVSDMRPAGNLESPRYRGSSTISVTSVDSLNDAIAYYNKIKNEPHLSSFIHPDLIKSNSFSTIEQDHIGNTYSVTERYDLDHTSTTIGYVSKSDTTYRYNEDGNVIATINGNYKQLLPGNNYFQIMAEAVSGIVYENSIYPTLDTPTPRTFSIPGDNRSAFPPASAGTRDIAGFLRFNPAPLQTEVTFNQSKGNIDYSLTYDCRPLSLVSGAMSENIDIEDDMPLIRYSLQTVLKRGPVIQDLATTKMGTRTVTYSATFPSATSNVYPMINDSLKQINFVMSGCSPAKMLHQNRLINFYQWLTNSSSSFNTSTRQYTRTMTWSYQRVARQSE